MQSLMEKRTNGSIRQNVVNKRGKIKGNERQSEMKGVFFFGATSVDEGSEGDCLYSCGSGPTQGAEPATAVAAFPFRLFIVL